jgi:hypothetical protein
MGGRPGASIGGVRLLTAVDKKYNRAITVFLCFMFGAFFLLKSLWRLLDHE